MKTRKNIITVAIDSPAAAGAGTQAKYISNEYNLLYLHYDPEKRPTIQQAIANIQSLFSENDLYENKYLYELMKLYINKIDIMNII